MLGASVFILVPYQQHTNPLLSPISYLFYFFQYPMILFATEFKILWPTKTVAAVVHCVVTSKSYFALRCLRTDWARELVEGWIFLWNLSISIRWRIFSILIRAPKPLYHPTLKSPIHLPILLNPELRWDLMWKLWMGCQAKGIVKPPYSKIDDTISKKMMILQT